MREMLYDAILFQVKSMAKTNFTLICFLIALGMLFFISEHLLTCAYCHVTIRTSPSWTKKLLVT